MLVERRDAASVTSTGEAPVVNLIADVPEGTVPDLHGMSARDAVRRLGQLGWTAQLSGDGFVASQDPPAGSVLEPGGVCKLVLSRQIVPGEGSGAP